jgi:ADP-ribose pyrophosphatase YjhB (NUDIX family)
LPGFQESYLGRLRAIVGERLLLLPGARIVIERADGHILLQRRADFGVWGVPGGIPEQGEDVESSVIREVFEETGLRVSDIRPFGYADNPEFETIRYPNGHVCQYFSLLVYTTCFEGTLGGSDGESLELRWTDPESLPTMLPNMRRTVSAYLSFKRSNAFQLI